VADKVGQEFTPAVAEKAGRELTPAVAHTVVDMTMQVVLNMGVLASTKGRW
jgi:hypothetical protein